MWNASSMMVDSQDQEDESWEVKAFAEDTGNVMGTTWPPRFYTCTFCRREFRSAQALGGHMNVHRRDRARLHHQAQPNFKNPNSPSSTLLIPSEDLGADAGLCLLFSLTKPNATFKPSSLNIVNGSPSPLSSFKPHPNTDNFHNFPDVAVPHNLNYVLPNSSINQASTSIDHKINQRVNLHNMIKKTDLAIEGIDLELRLGCSSSAS